jgi:hypothetical protein
MTLLMHTLLITVSYPVIKFVTQKYYVQTSLHFFFFIQMRYYDFASFRKLVLSGLLLTMVAVLHIRPL